MQPPIKLVAANCSVSSQISSHDN